MDYTSNYNLKKPGQNDNYNIENENDNMDIIDREIQSLKDREENIYETTNIGNKYYANIPDLVLKDGYPCTLRFNASSTGDITINLNNSTDKYVVDYFGNKVNNIKQNLIANFRYNAKTGNFQLLGKGGGGNALPNQILLNATATVNSGPVVGTIPSKGTQIFTPTTTDQTISSGQYLSGQQILKGDAKLIASNIISTANIFNIQGTATIESLGGRKYFQGQYSGIVEFVPGQGGVLFLKQNIIADIIGFTPTLLFFYGPATGEFTSRYVEPAVYIQVGADAISINHLNKSQLDFHWGTYINTYIGDLLTGIVLRGEFSLQYDVGKSSTINFIALG